MLLEVFLKHLVFEELSLLHVVAIYHLVEGLVVHVKDHAQVIDNKTPFLNV